MIKKRKSSWILQIENLLKSPSIFDFFYYIMYDTIPCKDFFPSCEEVIDEDALKNLKDIYVFGGVNGFLLISSIQKTKVRQWKVQ